MIVKSAKERRKSKIRSKIKGTLDRPRLSVFRSNKHLYVQAVDDEKGQTLAAIASSQLIVNGEKKRKSDIANLTGKEFGKKLFKLKIKSIVFDRGIYHYHGRIKKFADGIREAGIEF